MHSQTFILSLFAGLALTSPLELRGTCTAGSAGSGTCQATSSCGGFSVPGFCPGAANIQCCITKSCSTSSGSGSCQNTGGGCSGGSFIPGACPGSSDVQCCVKGASGGGSGGGGSPSPSANDPHPINQGALSLIESEEGFRADYYTIDGDKTIGYGHDCTQRGDCASINAPLSQAEGEALLKKDLVGYENCVCQQPNAAGLNANQYGALVSFTYNAGCGGLEDAFGSQLASKSFAGICSSLPSTYTNGGELSSRRQREADLCKTATSDKSGC